ncbi:MAG: hypothetical protein MZV63_64240 [Marinilabiliales bacterium]|nr:hypothetical protein [Marinilabiliales bacterium]
MMLQGAKEILLGTNQYPDFREQTAPPHDPDRLFSRIRPKARMRRSLPLNHHAALKSSRNSGWQLRRHSAGRWPSCLQSVTRQCAAPGHSSHPTSSPWPATK